MNEPYVRLSTGPNEGSKPLLVQAASPSTGPLRAPSPLSGPLVTTAVLLGLALLLKEAAPVLLPVTAALALTFVLAGPVRRLRQYGVRQELGAGLVVGVLLLTLGLLGSTLAAPAADWLDRAPSTIRVLIDSIERVREKVLPPPPKPASPRRMAGAAPLSEVDPLKDKLASEGLSFTREMIGQFVSFAIASAATLILLYFLLASEPWLVSRTVEAAGRRRTRALLLGGIRQAERDISLYLGTMGVINCGLGVITGAALALLGLPNPVLWGTVAAVLNFVPYMGPALMMALLLLAGSMGFGVSAAMLGPPAVFLALHAVESNVLTPLVLGHRLRLSPLSVFLSVMVWGWIWGLGGALVAVPVLLALRALCRRHRKLKRVCLYLEGGRTHAPTLVALLKPRSKARSERLVKKPQA